MSTPIPAEVIAEALAAHDGHGDNAFDDFYACSCGWTSDIVVYDERKAAHGGHQASAIAALPDIAVVSLPKPNTDGFEGFTTWDASDVHARVGSGKVRSYTEDPRMTSDEARQFAAELLAAANVADRVIEEKR